MKSSHLMVFSIFVLIASTSYLGYDLYETKIDLNNTISALKATQSELDVAKEDIIQKSATIASLENEVSDLTSEVISKQQQIKASEAKIDELTTVTETQQEDIQRLRGILSDLDDTGNLISENYEGTLILYDNSNIFESFKPLWMQVSDDEEDYSKLGIAFIYFRDKSQKYEEKIILGQYNTLYDTIFIYSDTTNVKTIYHEIAHTMYKMFFENNENNKEAWEDMYSQLKSNNLLSSQYAYQDELEGFAEEYAYYKTGLNPNQPSAVKNMMEQIDEALR